MTGTGLLLAALAAVLVVALVALGYLVVAPIVRLRRGHAAVLAGLKPGNEVITSGGMYARVIRVEPTIIEVELGDAGRVRMLRRHVVAKWEGKR